MGENKNVYLQLSVLCKRNRKDAQETDLSGYLGVRGAQKGCGWNMGRSKNFKFIFKMVQR